MQHSMSGNALPICWDAICFLESQGVPRPILTRMAAVQTIDGFIALYEPRPDDTVIWDLDTGSLSTLAGRAVALGETNVHAATTYAFDKSLYVFDDPLDWLRNGGRGAVVLDWSRAFDLLRDAPRVAIIETLLQTYREEMKPRRLPELSVIASSIRLAG